MADIDGIGMQGNRLVCVNFGSVMMPVAAMLMRPRQMCMRRHPLDRQKEGQQNKTTRGT